MVGCGRLGELCADLQPAIHKEAVAELTLGLALEGLRPVRDQRCGCGCQPPQRRSGVDSAR